MRITIDIETNNKNRVLHFTMFPRRKNGHVWVRWAMKPTFFRYAVSRGIAWDLNWGPFQLSRR
jgi:hypothetical protein